MSFSSIITILFSGAKIGKILELSKFSSKYLLIGEELDVTGGGDGDGKGADVREGDDEVAVFVDALDGALDTFEGASEETDALTLTTEEIGIRQEGTLA